MKRRDEERSEKVGERRNERERGVREKRGGEKDRKEIERR